MANLSHAYRLFHKGALTLARMEENGIRIDLNYLDKACEKIGRTVQRMEAKLRADPIFEQWRKVYGPSANLGSREQLAKILYDVLKFPCHEWTEKGRPKADEQALRKIKSPFVRTLLKIEKLKKAKGTFLEGIRKEVVRGYLHPFFNLHTVQSMRGSSDSPNFQNYPVRDPLIGKIIRRCFIPRPGRALVEIDYTGIEVRIAAVYCQDPVLIDYIKDPTKDMHRDMAAQCYKIDPEDVSKKCRYVAKNMFVFPQFYGSYYKECARHLWDAISQHKLVGPRGISLKDHLKRKGIHSRGACDPDDQGAPQRGSFEEHIKAVEEDFWGRRFRVYANWKKRFYDDYKRCGYFDMLTGFRIYGAYRKNEVINYPPQGTAFHCLLWSSNRIQREIDHKRMETLLIGEIHDSLLADAPLDEIDDYVMMAKRVMTKDIVKCWPWLNVPLDVEVETSTTNWHDKKPWGVN